MSAVDGKDRGEVTSSKVEWKTDPKEEKGKR